MSPLLLLAVLASPPLDLDRAYQAIRAGGEERTKALGAIATAGPDHFDALVARLGRQRTATTAQYRQVLDEIAAEYPDDKGVFRAPTRQQRELIAKRGEPDWLVLLEENAAKIAAQPELAEPLAETFEVIALIRGVASARRWERYPGDQGAPERAPPPPARKPKEDAKAREEPKPPGAPTSVSVLLDLAFSDAGAVFRDECGRQIRVLGNLAVPELIRYAFGPRKGAVQGARQRYTMYQLDRLDRQNPARAVQTAPDDRLRGDLLRAYGETRATPALRVVLNELDAQAARVRRIARWAWMQYVTVKPPPVPKRKRKLPGGRESREAEELYLDYRTLAGLEIRRAWKDLTGQDLAEDDKRGLKVLTEALLAFYDGRREAARGEALGRAADLARKGDVDGAVRIYDEILAEDPLYARRAEMAPTYLARARQLRDRGQPQRAALAFRQVEALADGTPASADAARERAELEHQLKPAVEAPRISVPASRRLALAGGLVVLMGLLAWMWRRAAA